MQASGWKARGREGGGLRLLHAGEDEGLCTPQTGLLLQGPLSLWEEGHEE